MAAAAVKEYSKMYNLTNAKIVDQVGQVRQTQKDSLISNELAVQNDTNISGVNSK
jgi:hypothetical protein